MSRCRRGDAMLFPEFVSRALVVRGHEQPDREWSAANRRVSTLAVWRASKACAFAHGTNMVYNGSMSKERDEGRISIRFPPEVAEAIRGVGKEDNRSTNREGCGAAT